MKTPGRKENLPGDAVFLFFCLVLSANIGYYISVIAVLCFVEYYNLSNSHIFGKFIILVL